MLKILQKFFRFSGEENHRRFTLSIILGVVSAFGQALRIPAIYLIIRGVLDKSLDGNTLLLSLAVLVLGVALQILSSGRGTFLQTEAGYTTSADKRMEIAGHLRYLPMGYFNQNSLGEITSVTTNTMELLGDIATRVVLLSTQGILESALITAMLLSFDIRIGAVALLGLLLFLLINRFLQHRASSISAEKIHADSALVSQILEFIRGIAEAKSYNIGPEGNRRLSEAIDHSTDTNIRMEFALIPILWLQSWLIKMVGVLIAALSLRFVLDGSMEPATGIVMLIASFILFSALESAGNYSALLRFIDQSVDKAEAILSVPEMDIHGEDRRPASENIELKHVDFSYGSKKVVDDTSLSIPEKSTAAFVGPSGGGKTTLCHLIARFWDVDSGEILLDQTNVKKYSMDSLMSNFSFVFQTVYLFRDTIANNIRFGQPDAPMEQVIAAAKKACCDDFISALPDGYETIIGEGGASLSGGQRQRISIARAIMKDAPIIILDEATANVDPENERELMNAIQALTKEKTILMIAHRLKTVRNADCIFVIDKGKVVQRGTHEELIREEGIYQSFIRSRKEAVGWRLGSGSDLTNSEEVCHQADSERS